MKKEKPFLIQSTPASERPRERCLEKGPQSLTLRECIALILGSGPPHMGCMGLATRILENPGIGLAPTDEEKAFFASLEGMGNDFLKSIPGLGPSSQARILAAFELGRRYSLFRYSYHRVKNRIKSLPQLSLQALEKVPLPLRMESKEWLGFVPIYRTGELGEICLIEKGVRTHLNTDPAEIFSRILALRPFGFFLFHNHPSGNTCASWQDENLTRYVTQLADQLQIKMMGHWIVTPQSETFLSPREKGIDMKNT